MHRVSFVEQRRFIDSSRPQSAADMDLCLEFRVRVPTCAWIAICTRFRSSFCIYFSFCALRTRHGNTKPSIAVANEHKCTPITWSCPLTMCALVCSPTTVCAMRMCADFAIVRLPSRNRFQFKLSQPQAERTLIHMRLRSRNIHRTYTSEQSSGTHTDRHDVTDSLASTNRESLFLSRSSTHSHSALLRRIELNNEHQHTLTAQRTTPHPSIYLFTRIRSCIIRYLQLIDIHTELTVR